MEYSDKIDDDFVVVSSAGNAYRVYLKDRHIGFLYRSMSGRHIHWNAFLWDADKEKFVGAKPGFRGRRDALFWISDHLGRLDLG